MSAVIRLFLVCVLQMAILQTIAHPTFRDYTYLPSTGAFYKIHTVRRFWLAAKNKCESEGAKFFYAEDSYEANKVISFWANTDTQTYDFIYVGISDLLVKGQYETIDGRSLEDVYNRWGEGEPNHLDDLENCLVLRQDGTLNDDSCSEHEYPFICKKSV